MLMMGILENLMKQIQLLSESGKTHAKEAMLPIKYTQYNEKKGIKGYCDQNALLTRMRNMRETAVSHVVSDQKWYIT